VCSVGTHGASFELIASDVPMERFEHSSFLNYLRNVPMGQEYSS